MKNRRSDIEGLDKTVFWGTYYLEKFWGTFTSHYIQVHYKKTFECVPMSNFYIPNWILTKQQKSQDK